MQERKKDHGSGIQEMIRRDMERKSRLNETLKHDANSTASKTEYQGKKIIETLMKKLAVTSKEEIFSGYLTIKSETEPKIYFKKRNGRTDKIIFNKFHPFPPVVAIDNHHYYEATKSNDGKLQWNVKNSTDINKLREWRFLDISLYVRFIQRSMKEKDSTIIISRKGDTYVLSIEKLKFKSFIHEEINSYHASLLDDFIYDTISISFSFNGDVLDVVSLLAYKKFLTMTVDHDTVIT